MSTEYDALLLLSFGGPERPEDVLPFLENVLRGKNVPQERMLEVARHYEQFAGVSPINQQNRLLITALRREFREHNMRLPIYWGNRNWHPLLPATLREMQRDGVRRVLTFVTSAFSSYSGCRQYLEDIARSQAESGTKNLTFEKLRCFYNHPGFIETMIDQTRTALEQIPPKHRANAPILFTAHSIPNAMGATCDYEKQLRETVRLVAEQLHKEDVAIAYQSRSGPPGQPWLEPDVGDYIRERHQRSPLQAVVIVPIGFVSDHMEVLFDLDTELHDMCQKLGIRMTRAKTAGTHPRFISMIRELIQERCGNNGERIALGKYPAAPDVCPVDCCKYVAQRPGRPFGTQ